MNKKVIVLGKGYLGNRIADSLGFTLSDFRVSYGKKGVSSLEEFVDKEKPKIIINAIGRTMGKKPGEKKNIDWCEDNKEETLRSNVWALETIARVCSNKELYLVNLGSGCIYYGYNRDKGFPEEFPPNFGLKREQYYAFTKILGEKALIKIAKKNPKFKYLQLRLRMPIDSIPNERNLITKLAGYEKIIDIQNSMTTVPDMMGAIKILIEAEKTGIYNLVNPGTISAAEIMRLYCKIVDLEHTFKVIPLGELSKLTKAVRSNCYLNTDKLKNEGIYLPEIHEAVKECLVQYKSHLFEH